MKKISRSYWIATGVALSLVVISAILLTKVFAPLTNATVIAGTFASIFSFFGAAIKFAHGYEERAREKAGALKRRRLLAYSLFSILGFCAAVLLIVAVVSAASLLSEYSAQSDRRLELTAFHVILPLLATGLFLALSFKVQSARMLDFQKSTFGDVARTLNSWRLPTDHLGHLESGGPPPAELAKSYSRLLDELCEKALLLARSTGLQSSQARNPEGLAAVLFLANVSDRNFIPVAVAGGTPNYRNALDNFRPPFFDEAEFRRIYNLYHIKVTGEKTRRDQLPRVLSNYRTESARCISSTGLIYALERKLVFEENLYTKCIAFRFEFLDELPEKERELFKFRQLVGIPIGVFGRKVGVLLLMSSTPYAFYTKDSIFRLMGDIVGAAVQLGISSRLFTDDFLKNFYRDAPYFKPREQLEGTIELVNGLSSSFSRPC